MKIVDEWKNALNERVVITDTGRLMVLNEKGEQVHAHNAKRYDRGAPSAPSAAAQQIAAYQEEAKQHPGLRALVNEQTGAVVAMCLEPVPYYVKDNK